MNHLIEPSSPPMSVSGILIDAYAHLLLLSASEGNFLELARNAPMHGLLTALRAVLYLDNQVRDDLKWLCTGFSSQIRTKLRDWAIWQARAACCFPGSIVLK